MSTPAQSSESNPHPDIDENLHGIWQKYGQTLVYACGLILLFYVGRAAWDYLSTQKESTIRQEFAAAKTPDQLKAFIASHPDHALAGVADVELGDEAYASGQAALAVSSYQAAVDRLKDGPLATRARIGLAMAQLQAGQTAAGQASLQKLFQDAGQVPVIRVEAAYQLAALAAAAGKSDEVQKLAVQMMQIDPNSPWTQKALTLGAAPR